MSRSQTLLFSLVMILAGCNRTLKPDSQPPAVITDLRATLIGNSTALLEWTAPGDDGQVGQASRYDMRHASQPMTIDLFEREDPLSPLPLPSPAGSAESAYVRGLVPEVTYYFAIRSFDDVGNDSEMSNSPSVLTPPEPDVVPPDRTTNLTVISATYSTVALRWTARGDDGSTGIADHYDVRFAGVPLTESNWDTAAQASGETRPLMAGKREEQALTGFQASTTYHVALRTVDEAGNSSPISNVVTVTTPRGPRVWRIRADGSGDAPSIQQALSLARNDDEILVGPGTYHEQINFLGKRVWLHSEAGAEATILNGSGAQGAVVSFRTREGRESIIEGFTISGGSGAQPDGPGGEWYGGGVHCRNSGPTIRRNRIIGNSVIRPSTPTPTGTGGGISASSSIPVTIYIEDNDFLENTAGSNGGGVAVAQIASAHISNNRFTENRTVAGDGAGIWILLDTGASVTINHNVIVDNVAHDHGGAIYVGCTTFLSALQVSISDNLLWRNGAERKARTAESGGGLWLSEVVGTVSNNTIIENFGDGAGTGGGISVRGEHVPTIERNIIAYSTSGGGLYCGPGSHPVVLNNIEWSNHDVVGSGGCPNWVAVGGNLSADPLFCNMATGDFRPAANSPALTTYPFAIGAERSPGCSERSPSDTPGVSGQR